MINNKKRKSLNKNIKLKMKNEKGITLVALVVTIIVLMILAGVSISLVLGENGIITKSKYAKQATLNAQIAEQEQLNEAVSYLENMGGTETNPPKEDNNDGEKKVAELKGGDYFDEKTPIKDNKENIIQIPAGFRVDEESGDNIEEGIVVEDKKGNEFVWIPVELAEGETFETKYPRTQFTNNEPTEGLNTSYAEPYASGYSGEDTEYESMLASVNTNKGFYVGRYEAGFNGDTAKTTYTSFATKPTQEQIEGETSKLVVAQGAQVYNYVPWGSAMNDITASNKGTEESPAYVIGAVELAQNFDKVNNYSGVTSTLIYGIQWDMVLRYVADEKHNVNDSSSWGNYSNYSTATGDTTTESESLQTTGKNENWQAKKIYDLAGNSWEWTMESGFSLDRVPRGR